ncbi:MAG: AAA family ATPase [Candidatus Handelsmanbacteria bacterium RIFCSPLOWO2_12_FULL_64_10]|uniref:AAA family ATPase n=1 Tax=Handelsmanbacteria sp. (strain RIFCSPLOWO2_12_FULL_64_10) TaxID=1817868 RepID=A0A1F6C972_HANXR|nr:MAG: AAA family ATPase [Candidatus Handelsmanbacteria bacterium RIFCSPLOWO2_12_FULL_64_10]
MTPQRLRELIAHGESLTVEFKGEGRAPFSDRELVEAVVCLANRPGDEPGWILVGVEDDGAVTGARPRHEGGRIDPHRVQALIANRTRPALTCRAELVPLEEKTVLVIELPASRMPVGTADGTYLRRAIGGRGRPECLPFHFHEMQAHQADRGVLDYATLVLPDARWEDLDPLEFERYRRNIRESRGQGDATLLDLPDVELAKALGAVEANHQVRVIRVLGLLLFGREEALRRLIWPHEVAFQVLSGTRVEVNDFFHWPLMRTMDEMLSRFRARNREEEVMVGVLRIGAPDYPERAFREGVANALIHRDYTRLGAVHVQWHADRVEISNPGGFPEGVRLDNLLVTSPRPRNPLLADAFKRAGIVERTARGIDTIFYEQLRNGRPAPSYERSTETDVVLVLPGGKPDLAFVRLVAEEHQAGRILGLDDLILLNHLRREPQITPAEATRLTQKTEVEARMSLQRLRETGFIEAVGERRRGVYRLSATTSQRLGKTVAHGRGRGIEPLQQEQTIQQFVQAHGRITRAQAAELCNLTSPQARHLLSRLVEKGILVRQGIRRGAFYVLASKNVDVSKSDLDTSKKSGWPSNKE